MNLSSRQRRDISIEIRILRSRTPAECYVFSEVFLGVNPFLIQIEEQDELIRLVERHTSDMHTQNLNTEKEVRRYATN